MKPNIIIGAALIAIPFVTMGILMVRDIGWRGAFIVAVIMLAILSCFYGGVALMSSQS